MKKNTENFLNEKDWKWGKTRQVNFSFHVIHSRGKCYKNIKKTFWASLMCKRYFYAFRWKKWNFSVQKKKHNLSGKYGDKSCSWRTCEKLSNKFKCKAERFESFYRLHCFFLSLNALSLTAKLFHQFTSQWKLNAYKTVINEKDIKFDVCKTLKSIPRCIPSRLHHQMSLTFFSVV